MPRSWLPPRSLHGRGTPFFHSPMYSAPIPSPMTTTDELMDILEGFAIDIDSPFQRRQKAVCLTNAGITPEEAEAIFGHLERTTGDKDKVPCIIAKMAMDPERMQEARKALRSHHTARDAREAARTKAPYPGEAQFSSPSSENRQPAKLPEWASSQSQGQAKRFAAARKLMLEKKIGMKAAMKLVDEAEATE